MDRPPRVSIVMPTLNQAGFIAESVASVLSQGVDDLELVIADGGSSDGSLGLLADLCAAHPGRIRWTSVPDDGPAAAVNAAVARSRAPIVGWLNSDDLYAPGAVQRALAHFEQAPADVMVYGEAEHVDAQGRSLGRYPSRGPQTPLADYADGCHVCQPTVFLRREVFSSLGGLDTSLRAAFDFEFWLRLFKACPGRVGFIDALQARSRLHAGAITMRMRERVAAEGIEVVHRHVGPAPLHWLLTHVDELLAQHPFEPQPLELRSHLEALTQRLAPWLVPGSGEQMAVRLAQHQALRVATPEFGMTLHADGWAPPVCDLRLRQGAEPVRLLRVHGRHAHPHGGALRLQVVMPDEAPLVLEASRPGRFVVEIPVAETRPGAHLVYRVQAGRAFVPAELDRGSDDRRELAYLVDAVELLPPRR